MTEVCETDVPPGIDRIADTLRSFNGGGLVVASPVVNRVTEDGEVLYYCHLCSGQDFAKMRLYGDDYDCVDYGRSVIIAGLKARGLTVYDFDTEIASLQQCHIEWPCDETRALVAGILREQAPHPGLDRYLHQSEGRAPGYFLLSTSEGRTMELKEVNGCLAMVREAA